MAAPMPAMTPQPSSPAASAPASGLTLVHWPAATRVLSANAPMPSAGLSSVPSVRVIFWVALWVRSSTAACPLTAPALATNRPPVQDHEVAGRDLGDALADRLDEPGGLVAEQERELVVDAAFAVVQIGVAHAASLNGDHRLSGTGIRNDNGLERHRLALRHRHHASNFLRHYTPRNSVSVVVAPYSRARR